MTVTTIILESDDAGPILVEGLVVRLFDTGGSFVTSAITDIVGEAIVDVPDADYDLYFFKSGVSIVDGMPLRITVDAADVDVPPNTYKIVAHIATLPEAVDPALCRISGDMRGSGGSPSRDGRLVFAPCVEAGYVAGALLSPQNSLNTSPDSEGHYEFELIRNMKYRAYFTHIDRITNLPTQPFEMAVIVPDLPSLDIIDLLFPVPIDASFTVLTLALTALDAADESVEVTVTYSDASDRTAQPAQATQFTVTSDNDAAIRLERVDKKLIITPLAAGVANITVTRVLSTAYLIFDPTPAFVSETLVVTVS